MGLFTDITELAKTTTAAAKDVAGTVLDVRRASIDFSGSKAAQDIAVANARTYAMLASSKPSEAADIAARSGAGTDDGGMSPWLVAGAVLIVLMMLKRR